MDIRVQLKETSQPIEYNGVRNAYLKGSFYCVYLKNGEVHKYHIYDIWRVIETYR